MYFRLTTGLIFCLTCTSMAQAELYYKKPDMPSKRIEVYNLGQSYRDIKPGDTLDAITIELLPNNPQKRETLKTDIIRLNPEIFIGGNPEYMLAGKRLKLPVYIQHADTKSDPAKTRVEDFSWGNIKRAK